MDAIQILLIIVLTLSTIFLSIVGIQLIIVLKELRKTLTRVNKIVDGFDAVGMGLQQGLGEVSGFINGFKTILKVLDVTSSKKKS